MTPDLSTFTDAALAHHVERLQTKAAHARKCGRVTKAKRLTEELITARIEGMRRNAKRMAA